MPQIPQNDDTGMFPALMGGESVKTLDNILKYFSSSISHLNPSTPSYSNLSIMISISGNLWLYLAISIYIDWEQLFRFKNFRFYQYPFLLLFFSSISLEWTGIIQI